MTPGDIRNSLFLSWYSELLHWFLTCDMRTYVDYMPNSIQVKKLVYCSRRLARLTEAHLKMTLPCTLGTFFFSETLQRLEYTANVALACE